MGRTRPRKLEQRSEKGKRKGKGKRRRKRKRRKNEKKKKKRGRECPESGRGGGRQSVLIIVAASHSRLIIIIIQPPPYQPQTAVTGQPVTSRPAPSVGAGERSKVWGWAADETMARSAQFLRLNILAESETIRLAAALAPGTFASVRALPFAYPDVTSTGQKYNIWIGGCRCDGLTFCSQAPKPEICTAAQQLQLDSSNSIRGRRNEGS